MRAFNYLAIFVAACLFISGRSAGADLPVSQFPSTNRLMTNDILPVVTEPAAASRKSRQITTLDFARNILPGVNGKIYGAMADNSTDDTDAINRALAAENYVFLPPGTYKITGPLKFTRNYQKFVGGGPQTKLMLYTAGVNVISNATASAISGVILRDFSLECATNVIGGAALYMNGFNQADVRNVHVLLDDESATTGFLKGHYWFSGTNYPAYESRVYNCAIRTVSLSNAIGIEVDSDADGFGPNHLTYFGGAVRVNTGRGAWVKKTDSVSFFGLSFQGDMLPQAVRIDGFGGTSLGSSIEHCRFEGLTAAMTNAIYINGDGGLVKANTYASGIVTPIIPGSRNILIEPSAVGGDKIVATTGTVYSKRLGIELGLIPPPLTNHMAVFGDPGTSDNRSILLAAGDSGTTEFNLWLGTSNRLWNIKADDNTNAYALSFSGARNDGNARTNQLYLSHDSSGNVSINGGLYIGTNYTASLPGENNLWVEKLMILGDGVTKIRQITGSPEGAIADDPGSVALDRDGKLWLKVTGSGTAGWTNLAFSSAGTVTSFSVGDMSPIFTVSNPAAVPTLAAVDPGGHRLYGWDDTDNAPKKIIIGSNLSYDAATDTLNASAGAGGYAEAQEEGTPLTARTKFNFIGAAATAADNAGTTTTDVTFDSDLNALAGLATTGLIARTGAGTMAARTIQPGSGILMVNGNGVAGDPTVHLAIAGLTTETTVDPAVDMIPFFDDSEGANNKMTVETLKGAILNLSHLEVTGSGSDFTPAAENTYEKLTFGGGDLELSLTVGTWLVTATVNVVSANSRTLYAKLRNVTDVADVANSERKISYSSGYEQVVIQRVITVAGTKTIEVWVKADDPAYNVVTLESTRCDMIATKLTN